MTDDKGDTGSAGGRTEAEQRQNRGRTEAEQRQNRGRTEAKQDQPAASAGRVLRRNPTREHHSLL